MRRKSLNNKVANNSIKISITCLIAFFLLFFNLSCNNQNETKSSFDVIKNLVGNRINEFELTLVNNSKNPNGDWFEININNNKVYIKGTSNVSICYAAYSYLKEIGAVLVSWEGKRVELPKIWPDYNKKGFTPFKYREYLNACVFGYTTTWWGWERWSQEIDWMALHGVNLPTALEGQEIIWQQLWKEYGLSDDEINKHFTGPAFLPWQRMGNINSHEGPLPQEWIFKKSELQKKILRKMKALGMHPVVPAFSGYVPKSFADKYPNSKISELNAWAGGGFPSTYLLDPKDPLFKEIGKRFIELYTVMYGKSDFYLADSFNEIKPPVSNDNKYEELSEYGKIIYETIDEAAPGSKWVMQGWLFGNDKEFWTKDATKAFLDKVPNDRLIIQDYANDRYKVWENQESFYGKQWTYGYVHNYGGSNPVYGDLNFYNKEIKSLLNHNNKGNLVGYGVMPEGLDNNSIVYEYIYDLPWAQGKEPIEQWLQTYVNARYGKTTQPVLRAWQLLIESVYSTKYWETRWWDGRAGAYLFFKRPTTKIINFIGNPGDQKKLKQALDILASEAINFNNNNLFHYDFIEITRHYNTLSIDNLLMECVNKYKEKDIESADILFNEIEKLAFDTDNKLSNQQNSSLNSWLEQAYNYGDTPEASNIYLKNAKMLITVWGGNDHLNDYASRAWHGMYRNFYWPRWHMFLKALRTSVVNNIPFNELNEREIIKEWETDWCNTNNMYK